MQLFRRVDDVERIVRRHVPDGVISGRAMRKLIHELRELLEGGEGRSSASGLRARVGWGQGRRRSLIGAVLVGLGRADAALLLCLMWAVTSLTGTSRGRRTAATRRWLVQRVRGTAGLHRRAVN